MPVWLENHVDEKVAARLEGAGFGRIVARCLAARGVTPETVDDFLSPSLRGLAPPECLPGVEDAARTVLRAVREMSRLKEGDLLLAALVEDGMFEEQVMFPVALYAEMLWDCRTDVRTMIPEVAMRSYVVFA